MMPWIEHCSELEMQRLGTPPPMTVLISIAEHGYFVDVPDGYHAVYRFNFNDMDSERGYPRHIENADTDHLAQVQSFVDGMIQEDQARDLAEALNRSRGYNIIVHCSAGISRSGAVYEVVLEAFPEYLGNCTYHLRHPNGRVKLMLKRAMGLVPIGA